MKINYQESLKRKRKFTRIMNDFILPFIVCLLIAIGATCFIVTLAKAAELSDYWHDRKETIQNSAMSDRDKAFRVEMIDRYIEDSK